MTSGLRQAEWKRPLLLAWCNPGSYYIALSRLASFGRRIFTTGSSCPTTSEQDALNELSPAEVLAGVPFEDREHVAPEQTRMLSLSAKQRLAKISALARMEAAGSE